MSRGVGDIAKGILRQWSNAIYILFKNMSCKWILNCFWLYDMIRFKCCCWLETLMCGTDFFLVNSLLSCDGSEPPVPFHYASKATMVHNDVVTPHWASGSMDVSGGIPGRLMLSHKWSDYSSLSVWAYWLDPDSMKVYTLIWFLSTSNGFSLYTKFGCGLKLALKYKKRKIVIWCILKFAALLSAEQSLLQSAESVRVRG